MAGVKGKSGRGTKKQEEHGKRLYKMSADFLCNNFHKFSLTNQLKVSLAMINKFGVSTVDTNINFENIEVTVSVNDRKNIEDTNRLTQFATPSLELDEEV